MEKPQKIRLDKALALRGLASSRARAQMLITDNKVSVNGVCVTAPDREVVAADEIALIGPDIPWVSRAGLKLEHALAFWNITVTGLVVLDVGASTGGFTDVLLARGAPRVYALDVGHGQLAEKLRNDPRVTNMEGVHINNVTVADFGELFALIVVDVSFISLAKILPSIRSLLAPRGKVIVLVKPQFEVGRSDINKGIVRDSVLHDRVLREVAAAATALGFRVSPPLASPIIGGDGNKEFLLLLESSPTHS